MSDEITSNPLADERRGHTRVQDAVGFHLQRGSDNDVADGQAGTTSVASVATAGGPAASDPAADGPAVGTPAATASVVAAPASVRRPNKYEIDGYADVKRNFPAVTDYIAELEERIRQLLLDADQPSQTPTHKVSLSAGGMAFADDVLLQTGEVIGVTLTLFPSLQRIAGDARVVSANDAPEIAIGDKPTYRIVFVRMTDADRTLLDAHVAQLMESVRLPDD